MDREIGAHSTENMYQNTIPDIDLDTVKIDLDAIQIINEETARLYCLIPISQNGRSLRVAMANPHDIKAVTILQNYTHFELVLLKASKSSIVAAIDKNYALSAVDISFSRLEKSLPLEQTREHSRYGSDAAVPPVVNAADTLIAYAVKNSASDIHIEPMKDYSRIRLRVDGILSTYREISDEMSLRLISCIKSMSNMDTTERRKPQDSSLEKNVDGKLIDLRISAIPAINGEKLAIRILGSEDKLYSLSELGFTDTNLITFQNMLKSAQGMLLVSGPTGSGKTTTLYAALKSIYTGENNILTLEDPVEYKLSGITQIQVNPAVDMTFAKGLRSILRQDPDIIMVGEIRDGETAEIAIRSAITGHLVLSTLHTNDALASVIRLMDMGIESYLIASCLIGVVSQRLVRLICTKCKMSYEPGEEQLKLMNMPMQRILYKGNGCPHCNNTGYSGRTAIHEVLPISRELRDGISKKMNIDSLREMAKSAGLVTLKESCFRLVENGTTTFDEFCRVTYSPDDI